MADAPLIGERVKYLGSRIVNPDYPDREIGSKGVVSEPYDINLVPVPTTPGQWPINVTFGDEDVQTCFEGEVERIDGPN